MMSLRPVFVLIGDSLTQFGNCVALNGWASLLQESYVRSVDILNRGLSGYTSKETAQLALPVLQKEWQEHRLDPQLITICLGANDAALPSGDSSQQHVPVDDYAIHLKTILQHLSSMAPNAQLIVMTPPPVDDAKRMELSAKPGCLDRSFAHSHLYAQKCIQVVHEFLREHESMQQRVALIDLYAEMAPNGPEVAHLFCDGLHFSAKGNQVVYDAICRAIHTHWPQLTSDSLQWQLPDHKLIH